MSGTDDLRLIAPDRRLKSEFLRMAEEFEAEGSARWAEAREDFESYFVRHEGCLDRNRLPRGAVPWTAYWLQQRDGRIVGRSSLRHELNDHLRREGGHIGYAIRPSARRRGYGTRILALTLVEARKLSFSRVLVTCDATNTGSRRIIERNGGVLEDDVISLETGHVVLRFWIDLAQP